METKKRLIKIISKCYENLSIEKKYGQMVKRIKKCIYGNFGENTITGTAKSITNIYSQKTLSSIKPKI